MKRFFLLLPCLLLASAVMGDALYKWVDDKGNVHYSDHPQPGAVKIHVPHAQTFNASVAVVPQNPPPGNDNQAFSYKKLAIVSPTADQVFWNVRSVSVSVDLEPGLQPGDTLTISLDGQSKTGGTSATFDDLDRGEHSATASVTDGSGAKVITAAPVVFYIQKSTQKGHTTH